MGPSGLSVLSEFGGAVQRRILALAKQQAISGHDVTVLSPESRYFESHNDGVRVLGLGLKTNRPMRDYEFYWRARAKLKREWGGFDVLHAHASPDAARWMSGVATFKCQTVDYFEYRLASRSWGHRYYQRALNLYDAIMPVSDYCMRQLKDFYPGLTVDIVKVPNGVDVQEFRPDSEAGLLARQALGLPRGRLIVYLGRVCEQKGSDLLIPLARALAVSHPHVKVVAVGPPDQFGDSETSHLMNRLAAAGVQCTGAVHESLLRGVLNAADLFVLPTRSDEMFGMAAVEALACGTPVVASELGGIPEAVGPAGVFFAAGNASDFSSAVRALLADDRGLGRLADRARAHASQFAWSDIELATAKVYRLGVG